MTCNSSLLSNFFANDLEIDSALNEPADKSGGKK